RLRNEANMLARLALDRRFPEVYELFEEGGDLCLAMELVEGQTLFQHVRDLALQGRHLPADQLMEWARQLAYMLGAIHDKDIIYRDLKSPNVIVAPEGNLRLLDFDVCQEIGAPHARFSPGTVGYMSEQQRNGEAPRIEHDVYGLGALLYLMATGAEPTL